MPYAYIGFSLLVIAGLSAFWAAPKVASFFSTYPREQLFITKTIRVVIVFLSAYIVLIFVVSGWYRYLLTFTAGLAFSLGVARFTGKLAEIRDEKRS